MGMASQLLFLVSLAILSASVESFLLQKGRALETLPGQEAQAKAPLEISEWYSDEYNDVAQKYTNAAKDAEAKYNASLDTFSTFMQKQEEILREEETRKSAAAEMSQTMAAEMSQTMVSHADRFQSLATTLGTVFGAGFGGMLGGMAGMATGASHMTAVGSIVGALSGGYAGGYSMYAWNAHAEYARRRADSSSSERPDATNKKDAVFLQTFLKRERWFSGRLLTASQHSPLAPKTYEVDPLRLRQP